MHEHIVKSFDQELQLLDKKIAQMGGLAERLLAQGAAEILRVGRAADAST